MTLSANCHQQVRLNAASDVLTARDVAARLAEAAGLAPAGQERLRLVVVELGTNLLRHAPDGGSLLLRALPAGAAVECLCTDRGPGIEDIAAALRDGQTSAPETGAPGLGFGLGAVRRLSDDFAIHSAPGQGTAILARVRDRPAPPSPAFASGAVMLPMAGMEACGDGWVVTADGLVAVVDGLGHGPEASLAARRAEDVVAGHLEHDPATVLLAVHHALRGTRGAVAMVVRLGDRGLHFAGIGNIAAAVIGVERVAGLHNGWGVLGGTAPVIVRTHELPWGPGDVLLMHSDGVSRAMEAFASRHLRHVEPTLAAAILLRDAATKLDDQTILLVRR